MKNKKVLAVGLLVVIFLSVYVVFANHKANAAEEPRVMLENYKITKGVFAPGESVVAELTFKNTSESKSVDSVLITYSNNDGLVYPAEGETNQIYIDRIGAGESVEKEIKFVIAKNAAKWENVKLNLSISFSKDAGSKDTNDVVALFSFVDKCDLSIVNLAVNKKDESSKDISITYYVSNIGNMDMKDVVLHLVGNDENVQTNINISDISYGSSANDTCYTQMNIPESNIVSAYFTYKDKNGNEYQSKTKACRVDLVQSLETQSTESFFEQLKHSKKKMIVVMIACIGLLIVWTVGKKKKQTI